MAIQDVIKRLIYRYSTEGADKVVAANQAVAASSANVAVATDKASSANLSLEKSFNNLERRYNSTLRAQQDYQKVVERVNAAVAQNPALQDRANAVLALASQHFQQVSRSAQAFSTVTADMNARVAAASGAIGTAGAALSALGPIGIAVAATLGTVVLTLKAMSDSSHALAEKAIELRKFSDVTGLSILQIQALRAESGKFGLTADDIQSSIQQFTARFQELRLGQGELLTQVRRVNPALAEQMQRATTAGEALTLLGEALKSVDNVFERNALVKAASGRGGLLNAGFLTGLNVDQLTQSYAAAGKALDDNVVRKIAQLEIDIARMSGKAKQDFAAIWAVPVLELERDIAAWFGKLAAAMRSFKERQERGELSSLGVRPSGGVAISVTPSWANNVDAITGGFGSSRPPGAKTPEAALADLQKQIAAMGDAATAADKLRAAQMQLAIAGREAGLSQEQLGRSASILNQQFEVSRLQAAISALGTAATVTEQYTARVATLRLELSKGQISQDTFNRSVANLQQDIAIQRERDRIEVLGELATETDRYKVRVMELQKLLEQGRITQETYNQALIAADPIFRQITGLADNFGQALFTAFSNGQDSAKAFDSALKATLSTLTSASVKAASVNVGRLLSGGSLFGNQQLGSAAGAAGMLGAGAMGYQSGSPLMGAAGGAMAGATFGPMGMAAGAVIGGVAGLFGQRANKAKADAEKYQSAIQSVLDANERMAEVQRRQAEDAARAAEAAAAKVEAAANRRRGYEDIIFGATTDTSTLEGQMLALEREREQAILDEQKAGNENAYLVQAAYEAKRYALLKAANDNIIEEEKRTAEERKSAMESAARTITDYLLNLRRGTDSPLSGSARLTAAQNAYGATLQLAQGGNLDALGRITQDAEAFRTAAQAMFGSGSGYQSVFNQIQQQLSSLPAVTESTDPVVRALNNIANRQETVYFDATASASSKSAALAQSQIAALSQQTNLQTQMLAALNEMNRLQALQSQASTAPVAAPPPPSYVPTFHYDDWKRDYDQVALFNQSQSNVNSWLPFPSQSNPKYTYRTGGIVGMLANGGMVGNGIWDRDSVLARYAGGGNIALAGGEFVMPAPQTRAFLPQLEAMRSGGGASNDNVVAELRALRKENAMMQGQIAKLTAQVAGAVTAGFDNQNRVIRNSETAASEGVRARNRGRTGTHG